MSFQCTVVTPEQQAFDAAVAQAIIPAHDGLIGILTGRAPLLVRLGTGPLQLDLNSGKSQYFFISGGVAQMLENQLTIVTGEAIPSDQIDYESAKAEFAEATATRATDERSALDRENRLQKARAKQAMAGKK